MTLAVVSEIHRLIYSYKLESDSDDESSNRAKSWYAEGLKLALLAPEAILAEVDPPKTEPEIEHDEE